MHRLCHSSSPRCQRVTGLGLPRSCTQAPAQAARESRASQHLTRLQGLSTAQHGEHSTPEPSTSLISRHKLHGLSKTPITLPLHQALPALTGSCYKALKGPALPGGQH